MRTLVSEIDLEVAREEDIIQLMEALQDLIAAKEDDIANETKIVKEMMEVRSKLKDGTVAGNLDKLLEQKLSVIVVEQELVNDLFEYLIDLQNLLEDARDRAARTDRAWEGLQRPGARSSTPYKWRDVEEMELVLQQTADSVSGAEHCIREISQRIDGSLVSRAVVLGEDVPPGLAKIAQKAASSRDLQIKFMNVRNVDLELDVEGFWNLKAKGETELFTLLAKLVGSATVDGSKAAVYGLKALLDTVTGKPAVDAANQFFYEVKKGKKPSSDIVKSGATSKNKVVETVQSTALAIGSVGKAGSTLVKGLEQSESAQVAGQALKKTTKELFYSVEAAVALSVKLCDSTLKRIEETSRATIEKEEARKKRIAEAEGINGDGDDDVGKRKKKGII